jgi:16S rRNA (uracil1498-N3)-methyltransferase
LNTFFASKTNDKTLTLNSEESWHCAKVLRMKAGEMIEVISGFGSRWQAELLEVNEKQTTAFIINEQVDPPRNYYLQVAIAPVKNADRLEWMLEKLTELGVDRISFLLTKNSERKNVNVFRLNKIIESAVKQSRQSFLPRLDDLLNFESFIDTFKNSEEALKLIAHCQPEEKLSLRNINSEVKKFIFLIGPEGDFRKDEIQSAVRAGFKPLTLGGSRLRTETAAIHIASYLRSVFD